MARDTARVAVVGGGRTGTPLIQDLLDRPYVDLVGVADVNSESTGALLAKGAGVFFTTDAMELVGMGEDIDLIIEVSGDPDLKPRMKQAYQEQGNRHTIILHDLVARLFISMVSGAQELVETYHPHDDGVG